MVQYFEGIGRRKSSTARVRIMSGSGTFVVDVAAARPRPGRGSQWRPCGLVRKCLRAGGGRAAILGEADAALEGFVPNNPATVLDHLHWHRAFKTPFELACLREASRRAARGHVAAEAAFRPSGDRTA